MKLRYPVKVVTRDVQPGAGASGSKEHCRGVLRVSVAASSNRDWAGLSGT
jgi:hypothetical protein